MNHYTYMIIHQNGDMYHGVRSCEGAPQKDTGYNGSGTCTSSSPILKKVVLTQHLTRLEADNAEAVFQALNTVDKSNDYLNIMQRSVQDKMEKMEVKPIEVNKSIGFGANTANIIRVERVSGNSLNSRWGGDMQVIYTDKGIGIDNIAGRKYGAQRISGHNWEKEIGKIVSGIIIGKMQSRFRWMNKI